MKKEYTAPEIKISEFQTENVMDFPGFSEDLPYQPLRAIRVITE